ncbi:MAG: TspO/MBR family protein [Patescibacteria group bacterium]
MAKINWFRLIFSFLICQAAGGIGAIFTMPGISTWYATLQKPAFNPPNWIFGPVWTMLFVLMGIALYLVWNKSKEKEGKNKAIIFFCIQLVLNIGWSFCFFYLQSPLAGLIEIFVLWIFILLTIVYFYKISKIASYLLIPYILWVSFAVVLNYFLFILNKI